MGNTVGVHRRKFTPEYRQEAAHLVIDTGRTVAGVARQIGVGEALLGSWISQEKATLGPAPRVVGESGRAELDRLRAEVQQLRMDNEFLRKAAVFFAAKTNGRTSSR